MEDFYSQVLLTIIPLLLMTYSLLRDPEVSHGERLATSHPLGNTELPRHPNRERYSKLKLTESRSDPYKQQQKEVNTIRIKKTDCYEIGKDSDYKDFDLINHAINLIEKGDYGDEEAELKKENNND